MSEEQLDRLRRRIRNLDAAMLGLMAERMELAREVGQEKRAAGIPLRDFEVEKRVMARADTSAEALGLAPELARGVMRQLVEEACRVQEIDHFSTYSGEAETILVVGGAGKMGHWLVRFFETQGHRVLIFDPAARSAGVPAMPTLVEWLAAASRRGVADDERLAHLALPSSGVEPFQRLVDTGMRMNALRSAAACSTRPSAPAAATSVSARRWRGSS